jgi:hypothetical protein
LLVESEVRAIIVIAVNVVGDRIVAHQA